MTRIHRGATRGAATRLETSLGRPKHRPITLRVSWEGWATALGLLVATLGLCPGAARAEGELTTVHDWRLAVGPVAGVVVFDPSLADYRWDTRPAAQSGAQMTLYRRRAAVGLRLWRAQTTQGTGIPGATQSPRVNLTGVEVLGQVRVARYDGFEMWGSAYGGNLRLSYDPDRLAFDAGGPDPITVDYRPISEWDAGAGIEMRRELTQRLALALQAEQSTFALDTTHRRGSEIVQSRERFYTWSLRLQVSWLLGLR
jgi:hypothetical protein